LKEINDIKYIDEYIEQQKRVFDIMEVILNQQIKMGKNARHMKNVTDKDMYRFKIDLSLRGYKDAMESCKIILANIQNVADVKGIVDKISQQMEDLQ
jgi:hypothetical protein